jgi:protein-S-isoprenylcysteine O-methyltransferase Ste14
VDDGGIRSEMVGDPAPPSSNQGKPFALRGAIYTIGFLLFILGIVSSLFHLAGLGSAALQDPWLVIRGFWLDFRQLIGLATFTIGLTAYLFCSIWLMYHGRGPHVEFDPPKSFVASGPYRWVRNPVVITLILTVLGEGIYLDSCGILFLVVVGLFLAHYQVTWIEEPRLRQRFGDSYVAYCQRVPRWIPRPPRDHDAAHKP